MSGTEDHTGAPDAQPPAGAEAGYGVWTYAIGADSGGRASGLDAVTGVGGTAVRMAACEGLCVLVSDVPLAEFGAAALRRNLEDLDWLETVARQHHAVIGTAASLFPLLPARLATVYSSDTALRGHLTTRAPALRAQLDRVAGRAEWGVKAYAVDAGGDAAERKAAGAGDAGPGDAGVGAGLAYLKRRRAQLESGRDRQAAAASDARALHAELATRASGAALHPPQAAQLSGIREPMLLNAAYLVDNTAREEFAAAVTDAADAHPGLRVELTGPWPPYSFAGDTDADGGEDGGRDDE